MQTVRANARYGRAIAAAADLLTRLRVEFVFAGNVARAAWLGGEVNRGPVDAIALVGPEQKNQVAMMASNRGFRVDRDEIEMSEELDFIPLTFIDAEGDVRVHVLVASNALYGRMVRDGIAAEGGGVPLRVPRAEDLALLVAVAEDDQSLQMLIRLPEFDRASYNRRLVSIGLPQMVVNE
ncbi:MAG TPA: hypothetical protein VLU46_00950 [Thermoanaerobaculia bacterium]|nr:hypothetical protein [Thermoanaerobaculia bacterium]